MIFVLFNITLSRDVPFCQPHCITVLLKLTFVLLCSPFLSPLLRRWRFALCALWLRCKTRVNAVLVGALLTLSFTWNVVQSVQRVRSELKHSGSSDTPTFKSINWAHILTIDYSLFSVMVGLIVEMLFMLLSIYNTV